MANEVDCIAGKDHHKSTTIVCGIGVSIMTTAVKSMVSNKQSLIIVPITVVGATVVFPKVRYPRQSFRLCMVIIDIVASMGYGITADRNVFIC